MSAPLPHWECGHRCHGLWQDALTRVGAVGLPPPGLPLVYSWCAGRSRQIEGREVFEYEGEFRGPGALRKAKRAVERALGLPPCKVWGKVR